MKNSPLMVFLSLSLALAGVASAASPKKPPAYNQNRLGPYAVGMVGMTNYTSDQSFTEDILLSFMTQGSPSQNLEASTDDSDIGFHAQFGYRFHRFFAAEFGLLQFGDLTTKGSGNVDFDGVGNFQSTTGTFRFHPNGFLISALGVLPLGEKFEAFGRLGYLFTNAEREASIKVEGDTVLAGSFTDDSQELVYGIGLGFNFNQVYSVRAEYQFTDVSDEELNFLSLGLQVRF
jgi:opacity protein-like surface antigen